MRYIVLSEKTWNLDLISNLKHRFPEQEFFLIDKKESFNIETLAVIKPTIIFVPHWSHIIPSEIYNTYECIVFHMTDLPFGRGGSPLQNLIIRGFKETMISALRVVEELDAGDIYLKRRLSLEGSAEEIYIRANHIIADMIIDIIEKAPIPVPQTGDVITFKRRKPFESNISGITNIDSIYDYIRMLDAEGYPNAFIESNGIKYSFRRVSKRSDGSLEADVIIKKSANVQK